MAKDIFNEQINTVKLPDYAKELRPGAEYERERRLQADSATRRAASTARQATGTGSALQAASRIINAKPAKQPVEVDPVAAVAGLPTWAATSELAQVGGLAHSQQVKLFNDFVDRSTTELKTVVPRNKGESDFEYTERLRGVVLDANPGPKKPTRTTAEFVGDVQRHGWAAGANMLGTFETLAKLAGGLDPTDTFGGKVAKGVMAGASDVEKNRQLEVAAGMAAVANDESKNALGKWFAEMGVEASNLDVPSFIGVLTSTAPGLVAGGGVGVGVRSVALRAGAKPIRAAALGATAGKAAGGAVDAAATAGEAAQQAYTTVMEMKPEELANVPGWDEMLTLAEGDVELARLKLAREATRTAAAAAGVAAGLLNAAPGALNKTVTDAVMKATGLGVVRNATPGAVRTTGRIAGTTTLEGATEMSGGVAANLATGQPWLEGTGGDFLLGSAAGFTVGGPAELYQGADETAQPRVDPLTGRLVGVGADADVDDTTPPDDVTLTPGTAYTTDDGASLVVNATGGWEYAPDSPRTPFGDVLTATAPLATAAPAPAPPADVAPPAAPTGPSPLPGDTIPAQSTDGTAAAQAFDTALSDAWSKAGLHPTRLAALNERAAETVASLTNGSPLQVRALSHYLAQLYHDDTKIRNAVRAATRSTGGLPAIGLNDGSALGFLIRTLGVEQPIAASKDQWAASARAGGDAEAVANTYLNDSTLGEATRSSLREVLNAIRAAGIPMPSVAYSPAVKRWRGLYEHGAHRIRQSPFAHGGTFSHELLHALTARGHSRLRALAQQGDVQAQETVALLGELYAKLLAVAPKGTMNLVEDPDEMMADLLKPEGLALAASIPVGQLSPEAQRAADRLNVRQGDSIMDALIRAVEYMVRLISPNQPVSRDSIAFMIARAAAETATATRATFKSGATPAAGVTPEAQTQAETAVFDEAAYRPAVVAFAKQRWGSTIAENGRPVWQNFVEWFGDSKVVDASGAPMVMYHGTVHGRASKTGLRGDSAIGTWSVDGIGKTAKAGAFFTSEAAVAQTYSGSRAGAAVYPVFLRVTAPVTVDAQGAGWGNLSSASVLGADGEPTSWTLPKLFGSPLAGYTDGLGRALKNSSFDGAIIHDVLDIGPRASGVPAAASTVVIALDSAQIKSATGNGNFGIANDAIHFETESTPDAAIQQGVENVVGTTAPPSPRQPYSAVQDTFAAGGQAPAASLPRAAAQALKAGQWSAVPTALVQMGEFLNVKLHDHLVPVKRWLQHLPVNLQELGRRAEDAMRLAPGIRDQAIERAQLDGGGRLLNKRLATMAGKYKGFSPESILMYFGYWTTAQRVPTGNQRLIQHDSDAVAAAQKALAEAVTPEEQAAAAEALDKAVKQLQARMAAVFNPATNVRKHGGGGVAGLNNAQAAQWTAAIEQHFSKADLQEVADLIYDLNGWVLTTRIESGATSPKTAAEFLRNKDVEPVLEALRLAYSNAMTMTTPDPLALRTLEAAREQALQAVRSNYVPLTGDPSRALDEDMFYSGSRQPNVARDYALTGRETSIPDDAITATFAAVLKTASYAGWAPFQDAVADIYAAMTPEERDTYGLHARSLNTNSGQLAGENAIVRRRGQQVVAYEFRDAKLLQAIRGATVETNNHALSWFGFGTRAYAYTVTQLNPFFAPKNSIRDFWERSEILRQRALFDANGVALDANKVARSMLSYLIPSPKNARMIVATSRYAFGAAFNRNSYEARYLEELLATGGVSVYGDRFARTRTQMIDGILKEKSVRRQVALLGKAVAGYNRMFDLGPVLSSYIAMREAGMTAKDAGAQALDLMNFRKRGENSGVISALFAFSQPAFIGGANAIATLYNPVTGRFNPRAWARLGTYTLVFMAAQALFRAMADDDEGGNKIDQQGDFVQNGHILIPVGDGLVKVPLAFGLTRVANGMARAMIGAGTGEMSPAEAFGRWVGGSVVPVVSPIEDTDIDWGNRTPQAFMMTFSPTWLKPIVSVGLNLTPWGTPVVYNRFEDTDQYKSEQFGKRVPPEYQAIARALNSAGFDFAPEEVRTLIRGYALGPFSMILNGAIENPYREAQGRQTINPFAQQVYANYSDSAIHFQFRDALEDSRALLRRMHATGESGTRAEREATISAARRDLSEQDRSLLRWRERWDQIDRELKNDMRVANKSGSAAQRDRVNEKRRRAETLALYQYRTIMGRPTTRVDVPRELAPK